MVYIYLVRLPGTVQRSYHGLMLSSRLTAGSFQFLFGRLYHAFPTKPVLMFSLAVFAGGSLLCSRANTSSAFIAGRAITGFATAGIISGAFAFVDQSSMAAKKRR